MAPDIYYPTITGSGGTATVTASASTCDATTTATIGNWRVYRPTYKVTSGCWATGDEDLIESWAVQVAIAKAKQNLWADCWTTASTNTTSIRWEVTTPQLTAIWPEQPKPGERLREIIRARQAPLYLPSHRKLLLPTQDDRELRARAAFRRIVGEHNWRTYCAKGYVSVRAKSGRVYQIFAGRDVTRVYENGRLTERLCVQLADEYPATDAILMRYVLVLSDEATFRRVANHTIARYQEPDVVRRVAVPKTDLITEWRRLRGAA
jgi:hypothetical protein